MTLDRPTRRAAAKQLAAAALNIKNIYNLMCRFPKAEWGDVLTPKEQEYLNTVLKRVHTDTEYLLKLSQKMRNS